MGTLGRLLFGLATCGVENVAPNSRVESTRASQCRNRTLSVQTTIRSISSGGKITVTSQDKFRKYCFTTAIIADGSHELLTPY